MSDHARHRTDTSPATNASAAEFVGVPAPVVVGRGGRGDGCERACGFDRSATRGDPMSPLRRTSKSIRGLTAALREKGYQVSDFVVRRLLREGGYSMQANVKTAEGGQHVDRDAQFGYLNDLRRTSRGGGGAHVQRDPVISVDAKKKELVGAFKNGGRAWHHVGEPEPVKVHDFIDPALGKANLYGIYDVANNTGWVSVGTDHDTAAFAVNTIATWWSRSESPCTRTLPGC